MSKRRFDLELHCRATVEIDDAVISAVDDDWRSSLYDLHGAEEIAKHIGYNLIVNGLHLSSMDGWADQDDSNTQILGPVYWESNATEMHITKGKDGE
jgi:Ser-tRNA(Ala) deacylase AlaX